MTISHSVARKLRPGAALSMLAVALAALWLAAAPVRAHEVSPAIADMERQGDALVFTVAANLEAFVAGIDLDGLTDTSAAESDGAYDALRALPAETLAARFRDFWPGMAEGIVVRGDGAPLPLRLEAVEPGPVGDTDLLRPSVFRFSAALPAGVETVEVGWAPRFGDLVLRQQGVEAPYTGYLEPGLISKPIAVGGAPGAGLARVGAALVAGIDRILLYGPGHAALIAALTLLATGRAATLRLGAAWGAGAVAGLFASAAAGVTPAPALDLGLVGAGLIGLGLVTVLRGADAPGAIAGVAGLGAGQGAVLARDPAALRPLDLGADPLFVAGVAAGLLVAALAVAAAVYVLTAGLRAGGQGAVRWGLWLALLPMPLVAGALILGAGAEAARGLLPLAALAAAVLALPALAGTTAPDAVRRAGGAMAALAGAFWLSQAMITGLG